MVLVDSDQGLPCAEAALPGETETYRCHCVDAEDGSWLPAAAELQDPSGGDTA